MKNTLGVNLRAKPTVFSREKISFSLELLFKPSLWAILKECPSSFVCCCLPEIMWFFCLERFPLPLCSWDELRYLLWHSLSLPYNYFTNGQNTKRTYGQPSELLFPKRWPLSDRNRTKNNINTRKVKRHRNSDTKNRQQRRTTKLPPWNYWGGA